MMNEWLVVMNGYDLDIMNGWLDTMNDRLVDDG